MGGLLGKGDDLFGFHSAADLVAFVRTDTDNDLAEHPGWPAVTEVSAHRLDPDENHQFDLVGLEELFAEKPTDESVQKVANTLAIVSSIGTVCELPAVTKFYNGNPMLAAVNAGIGEFAGKSGGKRWSNIAAIVGRSWDGVLAAIDEIITTPDVDEDLSARAAEELLRTCARGAGGRGRGRTARRHRHRHRHRHRRRGRGRGTSDGVAMSAGRWSWAVTRISGTRSASTRSA